MGKGSSSEQYDDVAPKTQEQIDLENRFYGISNQMLNGAQTGNYGDDALGKQLQGAKKQQDTANNQYNSLVGSSGSLHSGSQNALKKAETVADPWYGRASDAYDRANSMIRQSDENSKLSTETNKWYDQYAQGQLTNAADLLQTGNIPKELEDRYMESINRGLQSSLGTGLNDLSQRGVINSSIGSKAVSDLSQKGANAYNDAYLNTFNSVLGGYQGNAQTAAQDASAFADTYMNINRDLNSGANTAISLGQSLSDSGQQLVNNQLGISQGYNNALQGNLAEREQLLNSVPQLWDNATANLSWSQKFLDQMQKDRLGDTKTTAITQDGWF